MGNVPFILQNFVYKEKNANYANYTRAFISELCNLCSLRSISYYICTSLFLLFFVEQCITKRLQCLILVALTDEERNIVVTTTE